MDTKRPKGLLFDPEVEQKLRKIARLIAIQNDSDEDEAFRLIRRDMHRIFTELELHGESEMLDIGVLKRGKDGRIRLHEYPEEFVKMKRWLQLQQQYGNELGDVGGPPVREFNVQMCADSVIKKGIEQLAEHRGVPAEELKQLFWEQMEQAYEEFMDEGIGCLPDFGYICFVDDGMKDLEFYFNEEASKILEGFEEE